MGLPKLDDKTIWLQRGGRTRKDHLNVIRSIAREHGPDRAMVYWLRECPRTVSMKTFKEAVTNL